MTLYQSCLSVDIFCYIFLFFSWVEVFDALINKTIQTYQCTNLTLYWVELNYVGNVTKFKETI